MDNKLIVLGGVGRSGTSILGKLVGSLSNVEFFYEPKTIDLLFSKVNDIEAESWKALFKRNIYDDLLINSLAGRCINTNRHDISSIYNYKDEGEVSLRLSRSYPQDELDALANKQVIAFKLLDSILYTDRVQQHFPNLRALFIVRDPADTINSLYRKHWFSDKSLSINSPKPASVHKVHNSFRVPSFVGESDFDLWVSLSEHQRYGYYYSIVLKKMREYLDGDNLFVSYDSLLRKKEIVLENILSHFHLSMGGKTGQVLSSIHHQESPRDRRILMRLPTAMRLTIEDLYQTIKDYADKQLIY